MTKAELIDRIARSRELPPNVTKKCIATILDIGFEELGSYFARAKVTRASTPRFTYPGFGTFTKKKRAARRGVNPRTLEPMEIDASCTLDFKPGSELRCSMNSAKARAKTKAKAKTATKHKLAVSVTMAKQMGRGADATSPTGRRLVSRDDALLSSVDDGSFVLPDAPMQRARRGKRGAIGHTG